jgi:uncharacterized protein YcgI (DUF1989 family)
MQGFGCQVSEDRSWMTKARGPSVLAAPSFNLTETIPHLKIIQATKFEALLLNKGQILTIYDIEGKQVADLCAFAENDATEWLSNGRTFDYESTLFLSAGNTLYSNKSRPMFSIVQDQVGRHDFLYTSCSQQMYEIQYGVTKPHPNCLNNLATAFLQLGLGTVQVPTPFNVFMNVAILPEGKLEVKAPLSNAGDYVKFRAEMDLAVAISACPASICNDGRQKSIGYTVQ